MTIRYFLVFLLIAGASESIAQMKTVELNEVIIESLPFEKYVSGCKIEKSDSLEMARLCNRTLADYLRQKSTVYIKEQGNAMLASVSFRGTGSSHTGVFWYGINLNSLTLGSTDFNSVPLFLFDDVAVQYGGASSLHGSDAIGGSIHLQSKPNWTNGTKIQLRQDFGSFGHYFSGIKLNVGNGKWESKTRFFNKSLTNNFTYQIRDRLGESHEVEQENANVHNYGILQELNGKITKSGYLSVKGWYGSDYHEVQPLMVTDPDQDQSGDELYNRNLRIVTKYDHFLENGFISSGLGYVWDYQLFNDSDLIETKRAFANLESEWNLKEKTTLKAGGISTYIMPNVWSYEDDLDEWRGDVFLSLMHELLTDWTVSLNARKTFVPFTNSPMAPSLSTSYLIETKKSMLTLRGQVERSFRVPTFNDRYWGDQGRQDLDAENGYSTEAGLNLQHKLAEAQFSIDISGFYMNIDDWIAWMPSGNIWRPFNLKQVESTGVEMQINYSQQFNRIKLEAGGMFAYNNTTLLKGISESDPAVGHQLPYTPMFRGTAFINLLYRDYRLTVNNNYTGQRYGVNVLDEQLEAFFLTDLHLSKNISIGRQLLTLEGQVLNVFDVSYQNVKRYAMPGRNYLLCVNIFLNN